MDGAHYDSMTNGNGKLYREIKEIELNHLKRQRVSSLVNGDIGPTRLIDDDGMFVLDRPGYFISVGLPYTSAVWTLLGVSARHASGKQRWNKRFL
jgi:hypothetical protein